jgi:predicted alpha/beta superfamily hydrolase
LTPPCQSYDPPNGALEIILPQTYGGADIFLDFITNTIHSYVFSNLFPWVSIQQKSLFGHSFGALFALHTLYTASASFDAYLAASPSIWWNDNFILQEESQFYSSTQPYHRPAMWMAYGSLEEASQSEIDQSDEKLDGRARLRKERRMGRNCEEMAHRLQESGKVGEVRMRRYEDEDHISVVAGALGGAISFFLDKNEAGRL